MEDAHCLGGGTGVGWAGGGGRGGSIVMRGAGISGAQPLPAGALSPLPRPAKGRPAPRLAHPRVPPHAARGRAPELTAPKGSTTSSTCCSVGLQVTRPTHRRRQGPDGAAAAGGAGEARGVCKGRDRRCGKQGELQALHPDSRRPCIRRPCRSRRCSADAPPAHPPLPLPSSSSALSRSCSPCSSSSSAAAAAARTAASACSPSPARSSDSWMAAEAAARCCSASSTFASARRRPASPAPTCPAASWLSDSWRCRAEACPLARLATRCASASSRRSASFSASALEARHTASSSIACCSSSRRNSTWGRAKRGRDAKRNSSDTEVEQAHEHTKGGGARARGCTQRAAAAEAVGRSGDCWHPAALGPSIMPTTPAVTTQRQCSEMHAHRACHPSSSPRACGPQPGRRLPPAAQSRSAAALPAGRPSLRGPVAPRLTSGPLLKGLQAASDRRECEGGNTQGVRGCLQRSLPDCSAMRPGPRRPESARAGPHAQGRGFTCIEAPRPPHMRPACRTRATPPCQPLRPQAVTALLSGVTSTGVC